MIIIELDNEGMIMKSLKYLTALIVIIPLLLITSGCITFYENPDYISMINVVNPKNILIENITDEDNIRLFSIKAGFNNSDEFIKLNIHKENNMLIVNRIVDNSEIRDAKHNIIYEFHIYVEDINYQNNETILGLENKIIGHFYFNIDNDSNEQTIWEIDDIYSNYYKVHELDDNLLIVYLFPNSYRYKINFLVVYNEPRY